MKGLPTADELRMMVDSRIRLLVGAMTAPLPTRGELSPDQAISRPTEIVRCSFLSKGTTRAKWVQQIQTSRGLISPEALRIIRLRRWRPTSSKQYNVVIIPWHILDLRIRFWGIGYLRELAHAGSLTGRPLLDCPIEATLLAREYFTDGDLRQMRMSRITGTQPIADSESIRFAQYLSVWPDDGSYCLTAQLLKRIDSFDTRGMAFAFVET